MALSNDEAQTGQNSWRVRSRTPSTVLEAGDSPVQQWFSFLVERFPLATFQTEVYLRLGKANLPSTHPLPLILRCVLTDDGGGD